MRFHKDGFEQSDYHRVLKYYFLYCKGFSGDCDNFSRNWGNGVKNHALFRLQGCNYKVDSECLGRDV